MSNEKSDNLKVAELEHEIIKVLHTYNADNGIEPKHVLKALHQASNNVIRRLFNNE